jgi:hypothetical protein
MAGKKGKQGKKELSWKDDYATRQKSEGRTFEDIKRLTAANDELVKHDIIPEVVSPREQFKRKAQVFGGSDIE